MAAPPPPAPPNPPGPPNPPRPSTPPKWHSAGWWAAVGAIAALASVAVGLVVWIVPNPHRPGPATPAGPALAIEAEDDPEALMLSGAWNAPATLPPPDVSGPDCTAALNEWGKANKAAVLDNPVIRVTVTGESPDPVVIHGIRATVLSRTAPAPGTRTFQCPVGGPLNAIAAVVDLSDPPTVSYHDADLNDIGRLDYSLARGEAAVFYIEAYSTRDTVTWRASIDASIGPTARRFDINAAARGGRPFVVGTRCGSRIFQASGPHAWNDAGPGEC